MSRHDATDPLVVDVDVRDHDWTVTLRLGDTVPQQIAEDVIESLTDAGYYPLPSWLTRDVLAGALAQAVIKLDPIEACDAGETLTRAGSHPGECVATREDGCKCQRIAFNIGLCMSHFAAQQDAVEKRLAAQGFSVGGRSA